jgi:hypothetical protein
MVLQVRILSEFKVKAVGSDSECAQLTLQDKYRDDLTLAEAENLSFEIFKEVMEDKISNVNVKVASVTEEVHTFVWVCWCSTMLGLIVTLGPSPNSTTLFLVFLTFVYSIFLLFWFSFVVLFVR